MAAFVEAPILGVGVDAFQAYLKHLVAQGSIHANVALFMHAHNQYLHSLATGGVLGLAGLLAILILPLRMFWKQARSEDEELSALGFAGVLLITGYAVYCLTDSLLYVPSSLQFYVFMLMALAYLGISRMARLSALEQEKMPCQDSRLPAKYESDLLI